MLVRPNVQAGLTRDGSFGSNPPRSFVVGGDGCCSVSGHQFSEQFRVDRVAASRPSQQNSRRNSLASDKSIAREAVSRAAPDGETVLIKANVRKLGCSFEK
jgi:hypothetical protein